MATIRTALFSVPVIFCPSINCRYRETYSESMT